MATKLEFLAAPAAARCVKPYLRIEAFLHRQVAFDRDKVFHLLSGDFILVQYHSCSCIHVRLLILLHIQYPFRGHSADFERARLQIHTPRPP